jgi:hypothetical protein
MNKKTDNITLTSKERLLLEKELNRHSLKKYLYHRIKIILLSDSNEKVADIGRETGVSLPTVHRWIDNWIADYSMMSEVSKGIDGHGITDKKLTELMLSVLEDGERSGAPPRITDSEKMQIQSFACCDPSEKGFPISHWTHIELAKAIVEQKIVKTISPSQVGRILKKTSYSPISLNTGCFPKKQVQ